MTFIRIYDNVCGNIVGYGFYVKMRRVINTCMVNHPLRRITAADIRYALSVGKFDIRQIADFTVNFINLLRSVGKNHTGITLSVYTVLNVVVGFRGVGYV